MKGYEGQGTLLNTAAYKALFAPAFTQSSKPKGLPQNEPNMGILWSHRQNGIGHTGGDAGGDILLFYQTGYAYRDDPYQQYGDQQLAGA